MTDVNLLLFLFLAHMFCDFYLQPISWVNKRNEYHCKAKELWYHALIHGIATLFILFIAEKGWLNCLFFSCFIFGTHFLIDLIKSYFPNTIVYFAIDQIAHLILLFIGWLLLTGTGHEYKILFSPENWQTKYIVIFFAYLIVLKPASVIISMTLKRWSDTTKKEGDTQLEIPNFAGQRIGYLERILILTFIILNQFTAIGFLLAAKSIFRFGDLTKEEDKKLTEYVMLGTLTSFTITIFIGLVVIAIVPDFSLKASN